MDAATYTAWSGACRPSRANPRALYIPQWPGRPGSASRFTSSATAPAMRQVHTRGGGRRHCRTRCRTTGPIHPRSWLHPAPDPPFVPRRVNLDQVLLRVLLSRQPPRADAAASPAASKNRSAARSPAATGAPSCRRTPGCPPPAPGCGIVVQQRAQTSISPARRWCAPGASAASRPIPDALQRSSAMLPSGAPSSM